MPHYGSSHQWFNLDCWNRGKEVQFPAPPVLLLLSELWFADQPKTPSRGPLLPLLLAIGCLLLFFRQASFVFALFLFDFLSVELFILLRCLFFPAVETVQLFPSTNKCKHGEPRVWFIGPLKFLRNTWEPPKDFFCLFMFYEYI